MKKPESNSSSFANRLIANQRKTEKVRKICKTKFKFGGLSLIDMLFGMHVEAMFIPVYEYADIIGAKGRRESIFVIQQAGLSTEQPFQRFWRRLNAIFIGKIS